MKVKFIILIFIPAIALVGLAVSRQGSSYGERRSAIIQKDLLRNLGIEPVEAAPAPDFALKDLKGNPVRLRDLRGKIVLLNFWATWCPSCRLETPSMESLHREFAGQGLVVLAVDFQEGAEAVRSFYQEHNLSFPALLDKNAEVFSLYQAWSLPTTLLINKQGHIVGKVVGYRDWHSKDARGFLRRLLEDKT